MRVCQKGFYKSFLSNCFLELNSVFYFSSDECITSVCDFTVHKDTHRYNVRTEFLLASIFKIICDLNNVSHATEIIYI